MNHELKQRLEIYLQKLKTSQAKSMVDINTHADTLEVLTSKFEPELAALTIMAVNTHLIELVEELLKDSE